MAGLFFRLFFGLRGLLERLWGFAREYPREAIIIALGGLSGWLWSGKASEHRARVACEQGRAADRAAFERAQADATEAQEALNEAQAKEWKDQANEVDRQHGAQLAAARDGADRYIAAHRVPKRMPAPAFGGAPGGPDPAAAPDDSAGAEEMPEDAILVSAEDVRAASEAANYADTCHGFVMALAPEG